MYQKKVPKSERPDNRDFTIYNSMHTLPLSLREERWGKEIRIASIDPGTTNYAIRIAVRSRFHDDPFLVNTEYADKVRFVPPNATHQEIADGFVKMVQFLKSGLARFQTCHIIIIERQLAINYRAVRFSTGTLNFFIDNLADSWLLPIVLEVDPKLKGRMLGASAGLSNTHLKRWSVLKAAEISWSRGDTLMLNLLKKKDKRDDLADTVTQEEAVAKICDFPLTPLIQGCPPIP